MATAQEGNLLGAVLESCSHVLSSVRALANYHNVFARPDDVRDVSADASPDLTTEVLLLRHNDLAWSAKTTVRAKHGPSAGRLERNELASTLAKDRPAIAIVDGSGSANGRLEIDLAGEFVLLDAGPDVDHHLMTVAVVGCLHGTPKRQPVSWLRRVDARERVSIPSPNATELGALLHTCHVSACASKAASSPKANETSADHDHVRSLWWQNLGGN
jgi:hypothetical protein